MRVTFLLRILESLYCIHFAKRFHLLLMINRVKFFILSGKQVPNELQSGVDCKVSVHRTWELQ